MMKIVYPLAVVITLFALIWFSASLIDTNIHNDIANSSYGDYADWNLFQLITK